MPAAATKTNFARLTNNSATRSLHALMKPIMAAVDARVVNCIMPSNVADITDTIDQQRWKEALLNWLDDMRFHLAITLVWNRRVGLDRARGDYLIRRSMATILRNWHHEAGRTKVDGWELEAQLGHRRRSRTEIYALASPNAKDTVQTALQEALDELERLAPGALHRKDTGRAAPTEHLRLVARIKKPCVSARL